MIRAQARRSPQTTAIESGGARLSYAQVIAQAAGLAGHLRRIGVRPGDLVAVAVPRGIDLVPALLGVQLCGAAYVPLDPDHPAERLDYILHDAGARVLVTPDASGSAGLRAEVRVNLDGVTTRPDLDDFPSLAAASAAYAIYTSGSTGRPKGVLVSHRALTNFIRSMRERPALPDEVVLPAVTTVSFDIAVLELFLPLTTGGRVVVASRKEVNDPHRLVALLARTGAQVMQATPTTWRLLLDAGWSLPPGFTVLSGGERLPAELAERLTGDRVALWDLYGPTETTIWSTVTRYERGAPADFHPVTATSLSVLDEQLKSVAAGEDGELYIGGAGLAVGYLGRSALTAERFVADPHAVREGERIYRTGDLARRHPDGRIEILGRSDDQVKIRGFRIEPGEIENQLNRHPNVAEAAVRAIVGADRITRLVAYFRPLDPAAPDRDRQLRLHLAKVLPTYMIPAQFVVLSALPTTPNGKVDRSALPPPPDPTAPPAAAAANAGPQAGNAPPTDEPAATLTEQQVVGILAAVLGRAEIGLHEDFFAIGGNSMLAIQAINRLNAELAADVPINALFEARTGFGIALLLDSGDTRQPQLLRRPDSGPRQLSSAQWRLWLHQLLVPDSTAYNEPLAVRLSGPLDLAALETALTELLARHDVLRTRYESDDSGQPVAIVVPSAPARLDVEDGDPGTVLATELARPFDLAEAPPVRIRLVRSQIHDHTVVMVIHHIATDERSQELIARQLRAAYHGRTVPTPAFQYSDYADWQLALATIPAAERHLDFWRTTLAGLAPTELFVDRPRLPDPDRSGGAVRFAVAPDVAGALHAFALGQDATEFMCLLAGFSSTLARYTSGDDLAVGIPVSGRDRPELEDLVGMFVNTVVIRVRTAAGTSFQQLLGQVRETALAAHGHAATPFQDVVAATLESGGARPDLDRNPLFDVMFAMHGPGDPDGLELPAPPQTKFDLCCHLTQREDGGLDGRLEYATQLFNEATVTRLANDFVSRLAEVCTNPAGSIPAPALTGH